MNTRSFLKPVIGSFFVIGAVVCMNPAAAASADSETVSLSRPTEIPGGTIEPGRVKFEVEDRLRDRAIVRITEQNGARHELVLSVPNDKLTAAGGSVIYFTAGSDKQVIQGWKCPTCKAPLEFVYPKDQAVAVTQQSGKPVMAVDPTYDKLPSNLSQDDMKVVTLWLLTPKQITADGHGEGVAPAKYADLHPAAALTNAPASATAQTEVASAAPAPSRRAAMPHTAGFTYDLFAAGIGFTLASGGLLLRRLRRSA